MNANYAEIGRVSNLKADFQHLPSSIFDTSDSKMELFKFYLGGRMVRSSKYEGYAIVSDKTLFSTERYTITSL